MPDSERGLENKENSSTIMGVQDEPSSLEGVMQEANERLLRQQERSKKKEAQLSGKQSRKKSVKPEIFSGNPLDYWEIDWNAYVQAVELKDKEALRFVKKYLSGKARDCAVGLLGVNTGEAYRQLMRTILH